MTTLAITSNGLRNATEFINCYLNDEDLRREIEAVGPKPTHKNEVISQVVQLAVARGFEFTAEEYEEASLDYIDEQYGAGEIYATCCCHTSPSSSSSLPRSYVRGEDI